MDGEAWWATVHGVAMSRAQLSDFTHSLTHQEDPTCCGATEPMHLLSATRGKPTYSNEDPVRHSPPQPPDPKKKRNSVTLEPLDLIASEHLQPQALLLHLLVEADSAALRTGPCNLASSRLPSTHPLFYLQQLGTPLGSAQPHLCEGRSPRHVGCPGTVK